MKRVSVFNNRGFAYVEVLIAATLIAIILPAALTVATSSRDSITLGKDFSTLHEARVGLLEFVKNQPYSNLIEAAKIAGTASTATRYSEPIGAEDRHTVHIALFDGDSTPFTVTDENFDGDNDVYTGYLGMLWIEVRTESTGERLVTLIHPAQQGSRP